MRTRQVERRFTISKADVLRAQVIPAADDGHDDGVDDGQSNSVNQRLFRVGRFGIASLLLRKNPPRKI